MNHKGMLVAVELGLFLASAGCDPTTFSDEESLGNLKHAVNDTPSCQAPLDDKSMECGGGGDGSALGWDTGPGMNLAIFQRLADECRYSRCASGIRWQQCKEELNYARSKQLITLAAYYWGLANGYYPAIDRQDSINAICECH